MTDDPRLAQLEGYLREDPGNASLRAEAVQVATEIGAFERAEQLLAGAASDHPQVEHARGLLQLAQHRFADAVATFDGLLARGVTASAIRFNRAFALLRLGDVAAAALVFKDLIAQPDAPVQTLAYLMRCHHHAGDPTQAVQAWREAPEHLRTPQAAGVASLACLDSNRLDDALTLSERALAAEPSQLEALVVRATLAIGEGRTDLATRLLGHARQQHPSDGRVWSALAAAQMLQGDLADARACFQRAAQALPQHVGTWVSLAWCQILLRDTVAARTTLERALSIDRNFAEVHGALAVLAAIEGRADEARDAVERALRLDRASLAARYAEALLEGRASDPQAIKTLARRLLNGRLDGRGSELLERALQFNSPPH